MIDKKKPTNLFPTQDYTANHEELWALCNATSIWIKCYSSTLDSLTRRQFIVRLTNYSIARQNNNGLAKDTITGCDVQAFADESKESIHASAESLANNLN